MILNDASKPKEIDNRAYRFILNLQSTVNIEQLWHIFVKEISGNFTLSGACLVYNAGVLFKSLLYRDNKITGEDIDDFHFLETGNDFDYKISGGKAVIFKRLDTFIVQAEFSVTDTAQTADEAVVNELVILTRIFFNRLFLLLRIDNYEIHSIKDDITMAYNQNYLKSFLQNEIERCKRFPSVFSVAFFDLDNLKAINEEHGHLMGTEVLKEVAEVLRRHVRKIDLLSRFGGDEFVIVLLRIGAEKAYDVCRRIKSKLESTTFLKERNINIKMTGCFGIASFPRDGDNIETLISKADSAMYEVKLKGKNGIKIYQGD